MRTHQCSSSSTAVCAWKNPVRSTSPGVLSSACLTAQTKARFAERILSRRGRAADKRLDLAPVTRSMLTRMRRKATSSSLRRRPQILAVKTSEPHRF
jgi:hypothetical protein